MEAVAKLLGDDAKGCALMSVGSLGVLCGLMALRMSFFRLAGSPGEGNPRSAMTRWSEYQLLNAEWAPVGAFLVLANLQKGTVPAELVQILAATFAATRWLFAIDGIFLGHKLGVPVMTTCYVATLALSATLFIY